MMPNYDLGDRQLGVLPEVRSPQIRWGEIGRDIGETGRTVAHGIDRINEAQYRNRLRAQREAEYAAKLQKAADEREAEYRAAQGVDWYKSRWNGQDVQDPKTGKWTHVNGVVDRTWQEFDRDKTTALDEMNRLKREFRETEIYTTMTPNQRKAFDRVWAFKENEFQRAAQIKHFELGKKKIEDEKKKLDFNDDTDVIQVEGQDTGIFNATAEHAAARKLYRLYGTSVKSDLDYNDPRFNLGNIRFVTENNTPEGVDPRYSTMKKEYDVILQEYKKNRITNLLRTAETDSPNADELIQKARETVYGMAGKDSNGEEIPTKMVDDGKGNKVAYKKEREISDVQEESLLSLVSNTERKLKDFRETKLKIAQKKEYDEAQVNIGNLEIELLDPKKGLEVQLDFNGYKSRIEKNAVLSDAQKQALLKEYRRLEAQQTRDRAAYAKFSAETKEDQSRHGYYDENGRFIAATSWAKETDIEALKDFDPSSQIWQNPKTALIRVEAAQAAGRLTKADYEQYKSYAQVQLNNDAKAALEKLLPKIYFEDVAKYGVGLPAGNLTEAMRKERLKLENSSGENSNIFRSIQNGIYAKRKGFKGTGLAREKDKRKAAIDLLAEDITTGGQDEQWVEPETMAKVYDTVLRLAKAGVDPYEAVMQILAPTLAKGVQRDLEARLNDPDYFTEIVAWYKLESGYLDDKKQSELDQTNKHHIEKFGTGIIKKETK